MSDEVLETLFATVEYVDKKNNQLKHDLNNLTTRVSKLEERSTVIGDYKNASLSKKLLEDTTQEVTYDKQTLEIFLDGQPLKKLRKGSSDTLNFFEYVFEHEGHEIGIEQLSKTIKKSDLSMNDVHKYINYLGFDKDLKKKFFRINESDKTLSFVKQYPIKKLAKTI
ncbi:MAG: hypothetical protein ACK481_08875 [Candidatus Melainabacteria bacterium]|jgi:hypothetical protein